LASVVLDLLADGEEADLLGREPDGEVTADVLEVHGEEPLERAEDRAVEHDRRLVLALVVDVLQPEPLGHVEVDLDPAELPRATARVAHVELELRAVERALALGQIEGRALAAEGLLEGLLGHVPELVGADAAL